jgi:hypothetical protein
VELRSAIAGRVPCLDLRWCSASQRERETQVGVEKEKPGCWAGLLSNAFGVSAPLRFAREAESYPLITHVVLCGMSIAKEPSGSPDGVGFEMQANGSFPVIPLYLPVPPVMI